MKFQFRTNVSGIYTTPKRKRFQLPFKNERPRRGIPQPRFHEWRHWRSRGTCKVRLWREHVKKDQDGTVNWLSKKLTLNREIHEYGRVGNSLWRGWFWISLRGWTGHARRIRWRRWDSSAMNMSRTNWKRFPWKLKCRHTSRSWVLYRAKFLKLINFCSIVSWAPDFNHSVQLTEMSIEQLADGICRGFYGIFAIEQFLMKW